jgi:hypothetical protein
MTIQPISGKENQEMFNDLWWMLCHNDGRAFIKDMMKDAVREVALEPAVLDAQALAYLKRPVNLVDPSGKTTNITGTTTPATKFNWMAYNNAKMLNILVAIGENLGLKLDVIIDELDDDAETAPELDIPKAVQSKAAEVPSLLPAPTNP